MSWSKIKTIMIAFLFSMNIFMAVFMLVNNIQESTIPQEVIDASVTVLEKDGFDCESELIPKTTYDLPILNASFYSASDLSDMLFGKQVAFRTDGNSLVANSEKSTLVVTDNYFVYKTSEKADKSHSSGNIKKALEKKGINMSGCVYDEKERCFYSMYNNVNLFNMYIIAELDSSGELCEISALWPKALTFHKDNTLSFVNDVTKIKDYFPNGGAITTIEVGYSLYPLGNEKYQFVPAWRVRVGNDLCIIE